jgi:hypothetical protein
MTLGVLPGQMRTVQRSTRTFLEKAYDVLDNPTWYENDPFLVQEPIDGKLPQGRPQYAPSAIRGTELSCILGILNEYARDPGVAEKLKKYAEHHNQAVAVLAVAGLVRHGEWTRESAIEFAEEHGWTPVEVRGMVRLSRTPLEEAYDVLDNPRWHENDVMLSLLKPVDGRLQEVPRTWTPTAIDQKEREAILAVFAECARDPAVVGKLEKYKAHHNRTVAIHAVGGLVRYGSWTKESAREFAEGSGWTSSDVQEMLRLGEAFSER